MGRFSFLDKESQSSEGNNSYSKGVHKTYLSDAVESERIRYRCEQMNITRADEKIIAHASAKKEYMYERFIGVSDKVNLLLTDYIYQVYPPEFTAVYDAMKELEFVKEDVSFRIGKTNEVEEVLNHAVILNKWHLFKKKLVESEFYKEILKKSEKGAIDILTSGDIEFKDQETLKRTYDKILINHILFNNYRDLSTTACQKIEFLSQIFVNVPIELRITNTETSTDNNILTIHSKGELLKDNIDKENLTAQYDFYYKPFLKYKFTEYLYEYDIIRKVDLTTGFIIEAKAVLMEGVKNNYEILMEYNLKQVRL